MALTRFCCCCDLRRGCVVFSWLQMMMLTLSITTLIGLSDMFSLWALAAVHRSESYYSPVADFGGAALGIQISIGILFIKGVSCVALTLGLIKKCHLYYQPWLFISGIEVCLASIGVLVTFIMAIVVSPFLFLVFVLDAAITALNWYFWFSVYTVYKADIKPASISFELEYDTISSAHGVLL